jgi:hypothetical protein
LILNGAGAALTFAAILPFSQPQPPHCCQRVWRDSPDAAGDSPRILKDMDHDTVARRGWF